MVHTHILNMKMRRSRLKEKLKEAALKRKDRELAKEHGFNSQVLTNFTLQIYALNICTDGCEWESILSKFCILSIFI